MTTYLSYAGKKKSTTTFKTLLEAAENSNMGQSELQTHISTQFLKAVIIIINIIEKWGKFNIFLYDFFIQWVSHTENQIDFTSGITFIIIFSGTELA